MPQVINLKINGLATDPNYLSEVPAGALLECSNFNVDRASVATKRRGFFLYGEAMGSSTDRAKQLMTYKGRVLRHYSDKIEWDNGAGDFTVFSGSFFETADNIRLKYQEINGNLYFTSSDGVKKISLTSASGYSTVVVVDAGGLKALSTTGTTNYEKPGFFSPLSKVGYRVVWGIKDANSNTILGTPSPLVTVSNISTTETAVVNLSFPLPADITADHYYQIYRTALVTAPDLNTLNDSQVQDEAFLVIEDFPVNLVDAVSLTDITPEDFRVGGLPLYTNAISGEGILQANEPPPLAQDITVFRNYTFYANTKTKHRLNLSLVSIEGFVSNQSKFVVSDGTTTKIYTFRGQAATSTLAFAGVDYTAAELDGKYFFLRSASGERLYTVWFDNNVSPGTEPTNDDNIGTLYIRVPINALVGNVSILGAVNTALNTSFDFTSSLLATTLTIVNIANGKTDPYHLQNSATAGIPSPNAGTGTATFTDQTVIGLGEDASTNHVLLSSKPTVGQQIEETVNSLVNIINSTSGGIVNAFYSSTPTDVPGMFYLESRTVADVPFYVGFVPFSVSIDTITPGTTTQIKTVAAHNLDVGSEVQMYDIVGTIVLNGTFKVTSVIDSLNFIINVDSSTETPTLGTVINNDGAGHFTPVLPRIAAISVQTVANPTQLTTTAPHNLLTTNPVIIYNQNGTPDVDGKYTPTIVDQFNFTVPVNVTIVGSGGFVLPGFVVSSNEISKNRLYFSKFQQPEAVPLLNYIDVGPKDKAIKRILALRDSLFILKEDGVYSLSGDTSTNFSVSLRDSSASILSADSAAILNNQIYMLSTQGVVTVSDSGVEILSFDIEDKISKIFQNAVAANTSFAISSETDRAYHLFTTKEKNDTINTVCYRINSIAKGWTSWAMNKTCGVINNGDNKIYLGAGDVNQIEKERKNLDRTDHADREFVRQFGTSAINSNIVRPSSTANIAIGDVFVQTQYVTLAAYNRLLRKLDIDTLLGVTDHESTLLCVLGDNITNKIATLAAKLNSDDPSGFTDTNGNTSYIFTSPISLVDVQSEYNDMMTRLNESPNVGFVNYALSSGTTEYEGLVTVVDTFTGLVTLYAERPFLQGSFTVYKAISSLIRWVPNPCGDPSSIKQVTDATTIFEDLQFTSASFKFATDLVKSYSGVTMFGQGIGIFGQVAFGEENFGGGASSEPLRTMVPRDKSRCRYISCEFGHSNAREEVKLFGMSLTTHDGSERAYRGRSS